MTGAIRQFDSGSGETDHATGQRLILIICWTQEASTEITWRLLIQCEQDL